MGSIKSLNSYDTETAKSEFLRCCSSLAWAEKMVRARPFSHENELHQKAESIWFSLNEANWLEAFAGHSKIGDLSSLRKKYQNTKAWSEGEQSGVDGALEETLIELQKLNHLYEEKFGFIFIVFATGKSADEMLDILKARINNERNKELELAAIEQNKITLLRLQKLLQENQL